MCSSRLPLPERLTARVWDADEDLATNCEMFETDDGLGLIVNAREESKLLKIFREEEQ